MSFEGFLDSLNELVPAWLVDASPAPSWGYRFKGVLELISSSAVETMLEGSLAFAGLGTPTALPYLGDERDVVRGRLDTDAQYQVKLSQWIQRAKDKGSAYRIAKDIWEYLGNARVRVITRWGFWIDIATNGTLTTYNASWNWDSVSNPERSGYWSDMWIIIGPATYALRTSVFGGTLHYAGDTLGLGHQIPLSEADIMRKIASRHAAHSCVRAIIWTSDATRFNPASPGTMPDGTWGMWHVLDGGNNAISSGRDLTTCRYWDAR
jgi:hypothetical protein